MQAKVDIIVINWNSGLLTIEALKPYLNYSSSKIICNIIIVDNASSDNSKQLFNGIFNNVIYNSKNVGFGKACNQAFIGSDADYILLLNPDTLSEPMVIEGLVEFLEKNPQYGTAGPRQVDDRGNTLRTCGRFPTLKTAIFEVLGLSKLFPQIFTPTPNMFDWNHSESKAVDHVMGSFMLIRKSILDEINFMDDDYYVYYEDLDLSKRISMKGYKSFYHTGYSIYHERGGSGEKVKSLRLFYSLSSRRIYWKKYFNKPSTLFLTGISFTIEPFLRMIDSLVKEKNPRVRKILSAYILYLKSFWKPKLHT